MKKQEFNEPKNNSVKNVYRIAKKYCYKTEIQRVYLGKGYLVISEPFLKSPYKRTIISKLATIQYIEKIINNGKLPF